jgi:hypothetical protein
MSRLILPVPASAEKLNVPFVWPTPALTAATSKLGSRFVLALFLSSIFLECLLQMSDSDVVAESVCGRFEHGKRVHVGLLLQRVRVQSMVDLLWTHD